MTFRVDANGVVSYTSDSQGLNLQQRAAYESWAPEQRVGAAPDGYAPLTPEERKQFDYGPTSQGWGAGPPAPAEDSEEKKQAAINQLKTPQVYFDPVQQDWYRQTLDSGQWGREYAKAAAIEQAAQAAHNTYGREKVVVGNNVYRGWNNPYDNPGGIGQQSVGTYRGFSPQSVGTSIKGKLAPGDTGYTAPTQQQPNRPIGVPESFVWNGRSWNAPQGYQNQQARAMGVNPNQNALADSRAASNRALELMYSQPSTTPAADRNASNRALGLMYSQPVSYPAGQVAPVDEAQVNEDGTYTPPGEVAPIDQENLSIAPYTNYAGLGYG